MQQNRVENSFAQYAIEIVKCLIVSLILTLVFVLLSALAVKIFNISTEFIPVLNQINKGASILISTLICMRLQSQGYLRGLVFGVIYILVTFLIFSLINSEFNLGISLIIDLILGGVSGLISGIISVNLRK